MNVDVDAPALQERLKPVLNRGANMALAAEGFRSAEQFATVAHASRNTEVPFVLLKHRVLNEGKSVAEAIRESKPASRRGGRSESGRARRRGRILSQSAVNAGSLSRFRYTRRRGERTVWDYRGPPHPPRFYFWSTKRWARRLVTISAPYRLPFESVAMW